MIHEGVNRESRKGRFQKPLKLIKSDTIKSGKEDLFMGRGSGEKKRHRRNPRGVPDRKRGRPMDSMASS